VLLQKEKQNRNIENDVQNREQRITRKVAEGNE